MLPRIRITDLMAEVAGWTLFPDCFTHLRTGEAAADIRILLAGLLADGLNLGLTRMAEACSVASLAQLAWTSDWHIRDETYALALRCLVNQQQREPFAARFGSGTASSRSRWIGVAIEKSRITLNGLVTALFCDLSPDKRLTIPKNTELRDWALADLVRKRRKPIVLIVEEAHDLRHETLIGLKRLIKGAAEGEGKLSVLLAGHPKLRRDLRSPTMEEIG